MIPPLREVLAWSPRLWWPLPVGGLWAIATLPLNLAIATVMTCLWVVVLGLWLAYAIAAGIITVIAALPR